MSKLLTFQINGASLAVNFIETIQVKEGVSCDVYAFADDNSKDLAIVTVKKGFKTPLQRVLKGAVTLEGFVSGEGTLTVRSEDRTTTHEFSDSKKGPAVEIKLGEMMQWHASENNDLVFYEICEPPYEDGRFENLPE